MTKQKFENALDAMDALNANDPNPIQIDGHEKPAALYYACQMTKTLDELYPDASQALKMAARAQHIERWKVPRDDYPKGRAGYHRWRNDLKERHAQRASQILRNCGFDEEITGRVAGLIAKKNLKTDPETKALEDVACIVFFKHYAAQFAPKHSSEKVAAIIKKTWAKMTPLARKHASSLDLPETLKVQIAKLSSST